MPPVWGRLISQSQSPHLCLSKTQTSVGDVHCDLQVPALKDGMLCNINHLLELEGDSISTTIEITHGYIKINGKYYTRKSHPIPLVGGDEVVFSPYATNDGYIFQCAADGRQSGNSDVPICPISSSEEFKNRLRKGLVEDMDVSFENFPCYLSETTKNILISASFIHLRHTDLANLTSKLLSVSPRILMSGPAGSEIYYQERLTKALAKEFGARLLIIDTATILPGALKEDDSATTSAHTFKEGDRVCVTAAPSFRGPAKGCIGQVLLNSRFKVGVRFEKTIHGGNNLGGLCEPDHGFFVSAKLLRLHSSEEEKVNQLFEVAMEETSSPLIILFKNFEIFLRKNPKLEKLVMNKFENLPEKVVVIASHKENAKDVKQLTSFFPNKVTIQIPQDDKALDIWKKMLKADFEKCSIRAVLSEIGHNCPDLESVSLNDLPTQDVERVLSCALRHQIMNRAGTSAEQLSIFSESINYGIKNTSSKKTLKDLIMENEFGEELLAGVIILSEIGVTFEHIGALENVKATLKELVALPLQRPELFSGQLRKPCSGILLFGPRGTGKTMLAKAIATEAGANFINISASNIMSKWIGSAENCIKQIFSLARKISPTVVFVDEAESMLGKQRNSESEPVSRLKNEFMTNWDGLSTNTNERVVVIAATNRPYDLDEAVVRRLPRRLMVGLPDAQSRGKILRVILSKEELEPDFDHAEVANMTERYSGSDLKNLCMEAAYCPIREILKEHQEDDPEKRCSIRPLNLRDFRCAHEQVGASMASDWQNIIDVQQWNEVFGEGGSGKKETLSYLM